MNFLPTTISYWALQTVAMLATAFLIPKLKITGPFAAFITVVVLAFINAKLWDAALFFELPNSISLHAGLLLLVNGIIFWIVVKILPGIEVEGLWPAIAAPVVFTLCSLLIDQYGREIDWSKIFDLVIQFFGFLKTSAQSVPPK